MGLYYTAAADCDEEIVVWGASVVCDSGGLVESVAADSIDSVVAECPCEDASVCSGWADSAAYSAGGRKGLVMADVDVTEARCLSEFGTAIMA